VRAIQAARRLPPSATVEIVMTPEPVAAELLAGRPSCPQCQGDWLSPVATAEDETNFLCLQCRSCWHLDGGALVRVNTGVCPGCPDKHFCRFPAMHPH
jgi:hypothetical protein